MSSRRMPTVSILRINLQLLAFVALNGMNMTFISSSLWLSLFLSLFFLLFSRFLFLYLKKKWEGIHTTETYTQQLKQESNGWLVYATRNDEKKRKTFFPWWRWWKEEVKERQRERKRLLCFMKRKKLSNEAKSNEDCLCAVKCLNK
jgi:hypothetical protein